jgi:hypothetical protein
VLGGNVGRGVVRKVRVKVVCVGMDEFVGAASDY